MHMSVLSCLSHVSSISQTKVKNDDVIKYRIWLSGLEQDT